MAASASTWSAPPDGGCLLRFTHEFQGEGGETEASWRTRFEHLIEQLGRGG
ncbi:hypothetical protein GCM10020256_31690 [Streptomyces thermocoprophilus]